MRGNTKGTSISAEHVKKNRSAIVSATVSGSEGLTECAQRHQPGPRQSQTSRVKTAHSSD